LGNGLLVRSADLDEVVAFASAERDRFDQGQPLPYQALGSAISFLRLLNRYSNEFFGPSGDLIPGLGLVWGSLRVIVEVCHRRVVVHRMSWSTLTKLLLRSFRLG
jgi:hypothetical protein